MFGMGKSSKPAPAPAAPKGKGEKKPSTVQLTVRLEPRLRDKLELLGGEAWLREQIDRAKVPNVFGGAD